MLTTAVDLKMPTSFSLLLNAGKEGRLLPHKRGKTSGRRWRIEGGESHGGQGGGEWGTGASGWR